jgi:hypothetical protein
VYILNIHILSIFFESDIFLYTISLLTSRYLYSYCSAKAKNREHAKNTRIRKKHYIEALKESLKLLLEKRDKTDKDQRITLSRLAEQVCVLRITYIYSS